MTGIATTLTIVPRYAAVLALMYFGLSVRVIRARGRHQVMLGTGDRPDLERLVRVHGNFAEYVPFTLLLLAMAEWRHTPAPVLHILCLCLIAGRLCHAWGLSRPVERIAFRGAAMGLSFTALLGGAIAILVG